MQKYFLGSQPFDTFANVNIKVVSNKNKILQNIDIHNKATHNLTEGIVRFLRGEFTSSYMARTIPSIGNNFNIADQYIPSYIGIGNVGVISDGTKVYYGDYLPQYDVSYSDESLRREIFPGDPNNLHRTPITRSLRNDSSLSETYALMVTGFYQFYQNSDHFKFSAIAGDETNPVPTPKISEDDHTKYVLITEIGLFSGDYGDTHSKLLARVLLDEYTPITLTEKDQLIINWQLGVYSIDDDIASDDNKDYKYVTHTAIPINGVQWKGEGAEN